MQIKKEKQITIEVPVAHKCDNCGKIVQGECFPEGWHDFSIEEIKSHGTYPESHEPIVCSPKCYIEMLKKIIEEYENSETDDLYIDGVEFSFVQSLQKYLESTKTEAKEDTDDSPEKVIKDLLSKISQLKAENKRLNETIFNLKEEISDRDHLETGR